MRELTPRHVLVAAGFAICYFGACAIEVDHTRAIEGKAFELEAPLPTVIDQVQPADDAVEVSINPRLTMTLNKRGRVDPWTGEIALHRADDGSLVQSFHVRPWHFVDQFDPRTVELWLDQPLEPLTGYYVVIYRTAIRIDEAPWGYIGDYTDYPGGDAIDPTMWNFTTGADDGSHAALPRVIDAVIPAPGSQDVPPDTNLVIHTNKSIQVDSWTSHLALYRVDGDSLVEQITLEQTHLTADRTITVNLAEPLDSDTAYYVTLARKGFRINQSPWGYVGDYTGYADGDSRNPHMWDFRTMAQSAQRPTIEILLFDSLSTCFVGDACTDDDCVGLLDEQQVYQVQFARSSFRGVKPSHPDVATAEVVQCMTMSLDQVEKDAIVAEVNQYVSDIRLWTNSSLDPTVVFHHVPPHDVAMHRWGIGPWIAPDTIREIAGGFLSSSSDFVFAVANIEDSLVGLHHDIGGCGGTLGGDFGLAGAAYSWVPRTSDGFWFECATSDVFMHEWLHQFHWAVHELSSYQDVYEGSYPTCSQYSYEPAQWLPDPHDCLDDPDYTTCGSATCGAAEPWNQHILEKHWPHDLTLVANHCSNQAQDFNETGVDQGGNCY